MITNDINKNIELRFQNEYDNKMNAEAPFFILASCFGVLIYSIWDRIAIPNIWLYFLGCRLAILFIGITCVFITKKKILKGHTSILIFIISVYSFFSYGASLLTENSVLLIWNMSAIIAGFLWVVAVVTFSTRVATLLSIYFAISYAIFFIVNNTSKLAELPLNGGIFIVFVLVITPAVHTMRYKDMRKIFILKCEVEEKNLEILQKQKELEYQATYDALTGAFTRRAGIERLEDRIRVSIREKTYLTLVYLDIDNLKTTNDKLGHKEGDRLIKAISSSITNVIRDTDIFCRVGGDEFLIVFHNCRIEQAKSVMKRVEEDLAQKVNNYPFPLEMSTGIVEHDFLRNEDADSLIERADKVMYEVKRKRKESRIM